MAKKTKEEEYDIYSLKEEKKKKNKKKSTKKIENKEESNQFSFDKEIVIGVTKVPEQRKQKKEITNKKKRKTNTQNKKSNEKNIKENNVKTKKEVQTKKKNTNKQRKVKKNIVLSPEEQENRSRKNKTRNRIIKYVILIILFIIVILVTMFSPLFNIKNIVVNGNEKVTQNEIISLSQIQIAQNTFKLNKNKIKEQIKQNAYINKVNINRKLPSTIEIVVEERKTAYLLEYAGSYVYVDKNGYILEISTEKLNLPILQGAETSSEEFTIGKRLCKNDLEKFSTVWKIVELAETNNLLNMITRIDIENKENYKLIFETKEKVAYIGNESDLNTKILTIISILEKEEGKAGEIFVNMDLNKEYPIFRQRV